jgi:hypothetical protein
MGQASWAKMMSPRGEVTTQAWHPGKMVNKAELLSINLQLSLIAFPANVRLGQKYVAETNELAYNEKWVCLKCNEKSTRINYQVIKNVFSNTLAY